MQLLARWLCALVAFAAPLAHAQVLLETSFTLGKKPDAVVLPLTLAAGSYRLTITDFGSAAGPPRLARADVGVTLGSALATSASVTAANQTGTTTKTFTATAGDHQVIIVGQPAVPATRVGSMGVRIEDTATNAVLLDTVQAFTAPGAAAVSPAAFDHALSVPPGDYTLETTDFALPQALGTMRTTVIRQRDGTIVADVPGATSVQLVSAVAEVYELFIFAELAANAPRGLVGVNLRDTATGAEQFAEVHEIGEWPYELAFDVAAAAVVTVATNDLQFPFPLASLGAVVVGDGRLAAPKLTGAASATFSAAGAYTVYVDALQSATGAGSFGVQVTDDGTGARLLEAVQNVVAPSPVTDVAAVQKGFDIAAAGDYTLTLTDFGIAGFFDAFTSVSLALTRDNQIVGQPLTGPGNLAFTATPGHYSIAILADPTGTAGEGLLGLRVRGPGNDVVYEETAAVGTDFISEKFDVTATQSVDAVLTDLKFVGAFAEIKVAVTRGGERFGEIIGNGKITIPSAAPGTYFVNMLATPDAALGYSTLGLKVSVTPPLPTVTMAASATSVTAGGNTTLTWSSTNAASCAASGAWSGSRALSGSAQVGPLTANSAFTLSCTGTGGTDDETVNVTITAAQRSGGGGAADWAMLLLLALGAGAARMRRRRVSQGAY
jgi:hypothetical protein